MKEEMEIKLLRKPDYVEAVDENNELSKKLLVELGKLWIVAGPAIFTRISMFGIFAITQAFIGHIGNTEMAALSVVFHVLARISIGLLMGMASGLETLCGQAFGAKEYHMLGIYLQRSWIVELGFSLLILPLYIFSSPILKFLGQSDEISEMANLISIWYIPVVYSYLFSYTLQMYLQAQSKNMIITWLGALSLIVHSFLCWISVQYLELGVPGLMISMIISSWIPIIGQLIYVFCGGCPLTWTGFSMHAFDDLWPVVKLSVSSGVMLWKDSNYKTVVVHWDGDWMESPIYDESGWCPLDYKFGRMYRIDNLTAELISESYFNKVLLILDKKLKGHSMLYTGLVNGKRLTLKSDEDWQSWWSNGATDMIDKLQLYMVHVAPFRLRKSATASKSKPVSRTRRHSLPDPIPTKSPLEVDAQVVPSQPSQEIQSQLTQLTQSQPTEVTPTQPTVASPKTPKTRRRAQSSSTAINKNKSSTITATRTRRKLYNAQQEPVNGSEGDNGAQAAAVVHEVESQIAALHGDDVDGNNGHGDGCEGFVEAHTVTGHVDVDDGVSGDVDDDNVIELDDDEEFWARVQELELLGEKTGDEVEAQVDVAMGKKSKKTVCEDAQRLPEEDLDWLPDPSGHNPEIDELPVVEEYNSQNSSSDYDFDPVQDAEAVESDSSVTSLEDEGGLHLHEEDEDDVVDEQSPPAEYLGLGEQCDNLYEDGESREQPKASFQQQKLVVGMEWQTLYHCRRALRRHAVKTGFQVQYVKNDLVRLRAKCVENCSFFFFASKLHNETTFKLKKLTLEHKCGLPAIEKNKLITHKFVADELEDCIRMQKLKNYKPSHIQDEFWKEYTVDISYWVAWRARITAMERLFGNYEDGYRQAPEICRQLHLANPGSIAEWKTFQDSDNPTDNRFKGLCMGFSAYLEGFSKGCRPLVGLDGCFLKGKYGGTLLAATALDGNNGLYPLAIYICHSETYENWYDFLHLIKKFLDDHPKTVNFISDRHQGIKDAVHKLFENSPHRFCFRHYYQNFKRQFKGDHLLYLAWGASKAYTKAKYEEWVGEMWKVDQNAYEWLHTQEPVSSWARSHFDVEANCEHITNNFSESFNKWILELRELPLVALCDKFHMMLMGLMYDRKVKARKWVRDGEVLVPRARKIIENCRQEMKMFRVHGADDHLLSVVEENTVNRWTVNIDARTCTCKVWEMTGLPCVHAVASLNQRRKNIPDYCSDYHKVSTYMQAYGSYVHPMAAVPEWRDAIEEVSPPKSLRGAGRPRKLRRRTYDEPPVGVRLQRKCSGCGERGHNKRGCTVVPYAGEKRQRYGGKKPRAKRARVGKKTAANARDNPTTDAPPSHVPAPVTRESAQVQVPTPVPRDEAVRQAASNYVRVTGQTPSVFMVQHEDVGAARREKLKPRRAAK